MGAFASGGAAGYFGPAYAGTPSQQGQPFSFGAYASVGPSVWFSNAHTAQQLAGPFTTYSFNAGGGLLKGLSLRDFAGATKDLAENSLLRATAGAMAARLGSALLTKAGAARVGVLVSEEIVPYAGWAATVLIGYCGDGCNVILRRQRFFLL